MYNPVVRRRYAILTTLPALLAGCISAAEPPGTRGQPEPRHLKPESHGTRDIPIEPMRTQHVLEVKDACGNRCNFIQTAESSLSLQLTPDGVARAEDTGDLVEILQSSVAASSQQTAWSRTWLGTWQRDEQHLDITLKPELVGCKRTSKDGKMDDDCAQRRELRLQCSMVLLDLVRPRNTTARAWACRAKGLRATPALTPLPWVFGISEPLVVLDGGQSQTPTRRYALEAHPSVNSH